MSDSSVHFPIVIAGAGAAGLSLAWNLYQASLPQTEIALISSSFQPENDKTWCFWDNNALPDDTLVSSQWKELSVIADGFELRQKLTDHTYRCVKSEEYQRFIIDKLRQDSSFRLIETEITGIRSSPGKGHVLTRDQMITGDQVFQSVLRVPEKDLYASEKVTLKQHFLGWEIETKDQAFDSECAILHDFRVSQEFGFAFMYVLPYSSTQALVELTLFTKRVLPMSVYESGIKDYLSSNFQLDHGSGYEVVRTEFGVIPMVEGHFEANFTPPVYSIGIAGGLPKASTGYAFSRIQKDSKRITQNLQSGSVVDRSPMSPWRYRYYDLLMLHILAHSPQKAIGIFTQLFRENGFDTMFRFLDEKMTFREEIRIMASVPSFQDYFEAIWKTRSRILRI